MKKILFGVASLLLCAALSGCVGFLPSMSASSSEEVSSSSSSSPQTSSSDEESSSMKENSSVSVGSGDSSEEGSHSSSSESSDVGVDSSSSGEEIVGEYNKEIVDYFKTTTGEATMYVFDLVRIKTSVDVDGTFVGAEGAETLIIDGGEGATLTAIGGGEGAIKGASGATLVFKNLTIVDSSSPTTSYGEIRREGYLEFGGKLRFENCDFQCAAYFCDDADAEFIDCTFDSGEENMYAVWVSDGSVTFKGCTFTGWRALKLYEGSDNGYATLQDYYDVENVTVEDCVFEALMKKPGIAIDVFEGIGTCITIKNTQFNNCQSFSGYEGIDGVYESDIDTSTLTFVMEGVTVDGEPCDWATDRVFS